MSDLSDFIIRVAGRSDIEQIIELAVSSVVYSVSPYRDASSLEVKRYRREDLASLWELWNSPDAGVFVADDRFGLAGHVVVMTGWRDSTTGERQGWVFDLSVRRDCWGRGLGRALMEQAESFVRRRGCRYIGLGVTASNERAVAFYKRLGYLEERIQMVKKL